MITSAKQNSNVKLYGRGLLTHLLGQQQLVTQIIVGRGGQIIAQAESWDDYWAPLYNIDDRVLHEAISALKIAWMKYIKHHFPAEERKDYCFNYFNLLDVVTTRYATKTHLLSRVLGFECFAISPANTEGITLAAGTTTTRNPCYLLVKLKLPDAIEDSQYLPIITCPTAHRGEIFYHYRQHKLPVDDSGSILLYVATDLRNRLQSFSIVNECESGLWQATDPRVDDRAEQIAGQIIIPYLQQRAIALGTKDSTIDFIDLGAGSGQLTARICQELIQSLTMSDSNPCFRIYLIDLSSNPPARFFSGKALRRASDSLYSIGVDYQQWFANQQRLPLKTGLRIGLIIRFLHNLSTFTIKTCPYSRVTGSDQQILNTGSYLPSHCLHPDIASPEKLMVSNTHFEWEQGRGYWQPSLTPYYQGLILLRHPEHSVSSVENSLYLPIRFFNMNCLLTSDGDSIIARMLDDCDGIIIQDLDLRPSDLHLHCEKKALHQIAIFDTRKMLRLKDYHSYLVVRRDDPTLLQLRGERIW